MAYDIKFFLGGFFFARDVNMIDQRLIGGGGVFGVSISSRSPLAWERVSGQGSEGREMTGPGDLQANVVSVSRWVGAAGATWARVCFSVQ